MSSAEFPDKMPSMTVLITKMCTAMPRDNVSVYTGLCIDFKQVAGHALPVMGNS